MLLSVQDAFALRCALSLQPIPADLPLSPLLGALLATLDWQANPDHRLLLQNLVATQDDILRQVMALDPRTPSAPISRPALDRVDVPALPASAQLTPALVEAAGRVGQFHRDCTAWLAKRSPMTPQLFLESGALWAVGLAIARRCVLRMGFGDIYPNLYYLWVAPTTYYHKSTGLSAITDLIRETVPHLLLPATTSPEMLVAKLAGERPANYDRLIPIEKALEDRAVRFAGQRGIIVDEASKILIPKKYMEGHTETLMEMFDAPRRLERELRGDGKLIVYHPALSMIGATTPARLARYITDAEWEDGLMARLLCLTPTEREIQCVLNGHDLHSVDVPPELRARLLRIYEAFPPPPELGALLEPDEPVRPQVISARLDEEVYGLFSTYYAAMHSLTNPRLNLDERLRGNYGRFPVMGLKLALSLAVMDWADDGGAGGPRITAGHWARGQMLVEAYRASAHRLLAELSVGADVKNEGKVLDFIARHADHPPSVREILRGAGVKSRKDVETTLAALLEDGVIVEGQRKTAGRPARVYALTDGATPLSA